MPTYLNAKADLKDLVHTLCEKYHPELLELDVHIDTLWAYGDRDEDNNIKTPGVVKDGYKCYGICKILSLVDRAAGLGDVRIIMDKDKWDCLNPRAQAAHLDHELEHIVVGDERDDLGRPKIKMKKHDVQVGWFKAVAERHGDHSAERMQAKMLFDSAGQSFFPFLTTQVVDNQKAA